MPSTTNFNWTTPADTDLVKDGAAAIRTLGNGIDASFVDLKGGTTGQVLSKASNTDLDFTWTAGGDITEVIAGTGLSGGGTSGSVTLTNTVATAFDAAGDLVYGTGADTFTKLGIGTAGQVLKVNSGATAPEWGAAPAAGANWTLVNSGGTALTGAATITVSGISGADKIMVLVADASAGAQAEISVRFNTDTNSNYYVYGPRLIAASTYSTAFLGHNYSASGTTRVHLLTLNSNAAGNGSGWLEISGCNSSGVKVFSSAGAGNNNGGGVDHRGNFYGGYYNSASSISSVSLFSDNGNFDNGTVYIYTSA